MMAGYVKMADYDEAANDSMLMTTKYSYYQRINESIQCQWKRGMKSIIQYVCVAEDQYYSIYRKYW